MAEITKEQVEEFLQFNVVPRGIAVTTFCGRLAELALTALRHQEGEQPILDETGRDVRQEEAAQTKPAKFIPASAAALSQAEQAAMRKALLSSVDVVPSPDLLRGIALGIEAAARYCNDENMPILAAVIRSLNPADIAAKNPTAGKFPEHKYGECDAERNRAHEQVEAEEARERVRAKYPDAVVESTTATVYRVYTADGRKIFGSGPTEDAAWIDAAGRM